MQYRHQKIGLRTAPCLVEHEKKNRPKYLMWGRRMHLAIKAYQELLLTLVHMEGSKGDTVREAGKILMSGVF